MSTPMTWAPMRVGDHHRREADPAAAVHDDPFAGRRASLHNHGTERGDEAAAEARRVDEAQALRQRNQVDVGVGERDVLGEGAPGGEARLEVVVADVLVAGEALRAVSAAHGKGHRDPVARRQRLTSRPVASTTPASSCPGTWGRWISESWPIQPCQSLRQMPVASTRTTTPSNRSILDGVAAGD
jgi:hypothetical protein